MKTIGIFTSDYGHRSIAEAIAEKIETKAGNKYRVKVFHQSLNIDFVYKTLYQISPPAIGPIFSASELLFAKAPASRELAKKTLALSFGQKIKRFIQKNQISLCINTYFPYNHSLENIQETKKVPLINVVTDPRTAHSLAYSETAINLFFDQHQQQQYQTSYPGLTSGWFVRSAYETPYQQQLVKKELGLNDQLTVLVASGSEGAGAVLKILPTIINCKRATTFLVACGNNKFLYHSIEGIKKSIEQFSSSKATVVPLGFTKELQRYMQAADLVVGKAGPNTLFESVACETPFFAITHIHGQEDGNLEIIRDYNLGIVEENSTKANHKLSQLIGQPQKLAAFRPTLRKMKQHNQKSIDVLLAQIDQLIG